MDASSQGHGPPSFWTQANALLRKNICYQKRNLRTNIRLILFPFVLCILLVIIQAVVNHDLRKAKNRCGCTCIDTNGDGSCETVCGIQYSTPDQVATCPIPNPPEWPAFLQIPLPEYRAVRADFIPSTDLPDESCKETQSCPATVLLTGTNQSFAENLVGRLFPTVSSLDVSDYLSSLAKVVPGSDSETESLNYIEPAFSFNRPIYIVQPQCPPNFRIVIPIQVETITFQQEVKCVQGLPLWRANALAVNDELFKGYREGNPKREINEIVAAYDFLDTDESHFNVRLWYNGTYGNDSGTSPLALVRAPRSLNVASNAYLQFLRGAGINMQFDFVKEMPKPKTEISLDFSSILGALFFTWVVVQLFPVILTSLIYEKQHNLRLMMKMHGLGDGPYWMISYAYFLFISVVYLLMFVIFGSLVGLKFFTLNDYSIQFVFFFIYINLQIALGFLAANVFSDLKTASVIGYAWVFGSGLLGGFLFQFFVEDTTFSRGWVLVMEIFPGFSLYRGLYEFAQYAFNGNYMGISGMRWRDLNDADNGIKEVLIIMFVEWMVLLPFAYYLDQVASLGSGIRKHPLFFLQYFGKKVPPAIQRTGLERQDSKVCIEMEKPDVAHEREVVQKSLLNSRKDHAIICDNLKKFYPGKDGNPGKYAVKGLSLALPQGECFGMLGPNGAGKTTFINMMIGLTPPTSGTAFVQGLDIQQDMDKIYTSMGVCPQHDLLWETLTGREHLFFYGRLKNLKGAALTHAVDESLKSVNLFHGDVGDKLAGKYSGGMKRRLSVAISLIGDPKVVYMDEPSTGLDPASRNNLWNVVKHAKQERAIILTTHSMEEAEVLCDRLGIFVDGGLQCIGNPKELKARYGGSYVFTMTTSSNQEEEVEKLVRELSPNANKIYHISGTQKFELPKQAVRIADVFQAVENAKKKFSIHAWGLADTTLEDVFIEVARGAQSSLILS
ncbi:ABC transporter A family member 7-like [Aristolochia californica]|uniref:ABC transporter A family member 7-like n=1 Tax=Aristolochia californica TaxID=171875 RepID=UPI0035D59989